MSEQDWKPVVWDKKTQPVKNPKTVSISVNKKKEVDINLKKLDEDHENTKHKTISNSFKKVLQQERMKAQMSQKDLATAINVKSTIVQSYEQGIGIPNSQIISKMEKAISQKNPEYVHGTLAKAQKK
jgi:ribosome-binding protein aMBF1 (putative translation factor)